MKRRRKHPKSPKEVKNDEEIPSKNLIIELLSNSISEIELPHINQEKNKSKGKLENNEGEKDMNEIIELSFQEIDDKSENIKESSKKKSKKNEEKIVSINLDESENILNEDEKIIEIANEEIDYKNIKKNNKNEIEREHYDFDGLLKYQLSDDENDDEDIEILFDNNNSLKTEKNNENYLYSQNDYSSNKKNIQLPNFIDENDCIKSNSDYQIGENFIEVNIKNRFNNILNKKREREEEEEKEKEKEKEKKEEKQMPPKMISSNNYTKSRKKYKAKSVVKKTNIINHNNSAKNSKRIKYLNPELGMLYFLVEEYGIENVVDSIYKSEENPKNKLDSCLQGIKQTYGENKLIIMVIQSIIYYMKNNNLYYMFPRKKAFSSKKNSKKIKDKFNLLNIKESNKKSFNPVEIDDNENHKKISEVIGYQKRIDEDNEFAFNDKIEKSISIESHYNRSKDGNIYKYQIGYLLGKLVIFHCFDNKCDSTGIFDLETKHFKMQKKHNLEYSKHDYIINYDKNSDTIFKEMIEKNYSDGQIFREGKVMIVRFYS